MPGDVSGKFVDVVKTAGKPKNGKTKTGSDDQALKYLQNLYKIESDAKEQGLTGEDLLHCIGPARV